MRRTLVLTAVLALVTACGTSGEPTTGAPVQDGSADARISSDGPERAAAEDIAARFAEAANRGDEPAVAALFAPDARFDSVGRIYPSRADIMDRFLVPEVLEVGGRYQPGERRWDGERLVVTYEFTTGSGGQERFTYAYLVRDGLIHDVVGRYV